MGTLYKKLCIICFTALAALSARSQVSTLYTFSQFAGTYNAITGGTVFSTTTFDDEHIIDPIGTGFIPPATLPGATGPGVSIGFNFLFDNMVFDRIGISNNGYLVFGNSADGNLAISESMVDWNRPISTVSSSAPKFQHRIAAFGTDLLGTATSNIRVETLGAYPTRTAVIQWSNYQCFAPPPATADNINFQIKLYETTNMVDVVYGTVYSTLDSCGQVGLRGGSNLDYNNRSVSPPNIYATSVAGTANNYFVRYNTTLFPTSGQTYRWSLPQCSGALAVLSTTSGSSYVCPNEAFNLNLQNTYTVSGITYTWSSSPTQNGAYTSVPNTNSGMFGVPAGITATTWYRAGATCIHSSSSINATPFEVQVQGVTVNSIPYYEGFEGVSSNNRLPNCSWSSNALGTTALTYTTSTSNNRVPRTGNAFASFYSTSPFSDKYFYSNGLQLSAGITYSADLWYTTDFSGNNVWSQLSIAVGASQSAAGLSIIASESSVSSGPYKQLGGTFTVATAGIYYIAIKGLAGTGTSQYLSWDDLSVTIPCSGGGASNSPTVITSVSNNTICEGTPATLSASGADTYTWSTGANTSVISVMPDSTTIYSVWGTNSLTGCMEMKVETIVVNPSPTLSVLANLPIVCIGSPAQLSAQGANSYVWGAGAGNNAVITVTPNAPTVYTVTGTNLISCSTTATIQIMTHPAFTVTANAGSALPICIGEKITLTGGGASTYTWTSNSALVLMGNPVNAYPQLTTTYTVTGTNSNGCKKTASLTQTVNECVGLKEVQASQSHVFPNPTNGVLNLEFSTASLKTLQISDMSGRVIKTISTSNQAEILDLSDLANGIYFLNVISSESSEVIKIIKNN